MQKKFNTNQLPRGYAIANPPPPPPPPSNKKGVNGMTPWEPLTPRQKEYINGCSFILPQLRSAISHSRFGYCRNRTLLFCLGQFEVSGKLQFPSRLIELKWWCSTSSGEPFHEQRRYIYDIDDIDMTAVINLWDLDTSEMDVQPVKNDDELQAEINKKLEEIAKLQKKLHSNNTSMINIASQSIIRQNQSDIIIPDVEILPPKKPSVQSNNVIGDMMNYNIAPSSFETDKEKKPVYEDVIVTNKIRPQVQKQSKPSRMSAQSQKDKPSREIMFDFNSGVISVDERKKNAFESPSKKNENVEIDYDEDVEEFEAFLAEEDIKKSKKSSNKKANMNVNTDALKNEIIGKFKEANQPKGPKSKTVEKKHGKGKRGKRSATRPIEELDGLDSEEIELNLKAGAEKPMDDIVVLEEYQSDDGECHL